MDAGSTSPPSAGAPWRGATGLLRSWCERHVAARRERRALAALGAALARAGPEAAPACGTVQAALGDVARRDGALAGLRAALTASLEEDRRDYADASAWLCPLVIVRGMTTRLLVRERMRRERRALRGAHVVLASVALDDGGGRLAGAGPVATTAIAARARRVAAERGADDQRAIVNATRAATVARCAAREAAALGRPLVGEVRARLVPRVPALAGLAVGWWIASTFTDSRWGAMLHRLGIGSGPRRVVSTRQLHAMEFWLPVLAAALCSYAGSRIAALVRSRYAPAPAPGPDHAPGDGDGRTAPAPRAGGVGDG